MSVLLKWIYGFDAIPIKFPANYLVDIDKLIIKVIWKDKRLRIANTILRKNKDVTVHFSEPIECTQQA
jgi:hypothetical protein